MIIFDLDGTLADCEHRRHFVDPIKNHCKDCATWLKLEPIDHLPCPSCGKCPTNFKPDWKSFYEACDKDEPIKSTIYIFNNLIHNEIIEIWSGRCESQRNKTLNWFFEKLLVTPDYDDLNYVDKILKMRPIGDSTPDDKLKERWLDESISEAKTIDFVFDDRKKVCDMWRRRGIFVFDVNQTGEDF